MKPKISILNVHEGKPTEKKASGYTLMTLTVLENLQPSGDGGCIDNDL
jgi:hypothetical protein